MTDGHPFIRKLLWDQEDNHSDESTEEMILMMIETSTQRSLHQLNDPMNIPHLDKTKLNQTLEPDDENVINVVEDEPEEEPPKIHTTKKEVKQRQSDTIPSTTTVLTIHEDDYEENVFVKATNEENVFIEDTYKGDRDDKTFKGNLKIEDTHEEENVFVKATNGENVFIKNTNQGDRDAKTFQGNLKIEDTYEEDMLTFTFMKKDVQQMIAKANMEDMDAKTSQDNFMIGDTYQYPVHEADYKEDMFAKDNQQYMMNTQQGTAQREGRDAGTFQGHIVIRNTYKKEVLARQFVEERVLPMTDNAYKEDMMTVSHQEIVMIMNAHKKYVQLAVDKTAIEENVDEAQFDMIYKHLIDNGQDDIKMNDLMNNRGDEEDARKLAVSAIASRRGEKGA
jgi:hypothetical protein